MTDPQDPKEDKDLKVDDSKLESFVEDFRATIFDEAVKERVRDLDAEARRRSEKKDSDEDENTRAKSLIDDIIEETESD